MLPIKYRACVCSEANVELGLFRSPSQNAKPGGYTNTGRGGGRILGQDRQIGIEDNCEIKRPERHH